MDESQELRDHFERWMDAVSRADVESIVDAYLDGAGIVVVGTDGDGWIEGSDAIRKAYTREANDYEIRADVVHAFEEGDVGWVVGRLTLLFRDATEVTVRATAAAYREQDVWKMVTTHLSVPRTA